MWLLFRVVRMGCGYVGECGAGNAGDAGEIELRTETETGSGKTYVTSGSNYDHESMGKSSPLKGETNSTNSKRT